MAHIARAALESIAFQSAALLQAMSRDAVAAGGAPVAELRVDGGACVNDLLMQFQADLLGIPVVRPKVHRDHGARRGLPRRAWRAASTRGLDELAAQWQVERTLPPDDAARARRRADGALGARGAAGHGLTDALGERPEDRRSRGGAIHEQFTVLAGAAAHSRPAVHGRARGRSYDRGAPLRAADDCCRKAPASSPGLGFGRRFMLIVILPLVLGALLLGASVLSDGNRIPGLLAHAAKESGVMYCTEGKIVHGDGSLADRAVEPGTFRCTAWKLRGEQSYTVKGAMPWPTSPRR